MTKGKETHMFPGANTPEGFRSHYRDALRGLDHVFILKGGPGSGKSTLMRRLGEDFLDAGYDVEFWNCSSDDASLDGIRIPAVSAAVVDGTPPHALEPRFPGVVEELVDLGVCWDVEKLQTQKAEIFRCQNTLQDLYQRCYRHLEKAGRLVEAEREENAAHALPEEAERMAELLSASLFGSGEQRIRKMFCSSVTPRGLISYKEELSRRMPKRYLLWGAPGSGREAVLAALCEKAATLGCRAEIFSGALAPDTPELLCLPDAGIAVMTLDAPPEQALPGDTVLPCGSSRRNTEARLQAAEATREGARTLRQAKATHDELEACYRQAMDFAAVDEIAQRLRRRLDDLASR